MYSVLRHRYKNIYQFYFVKFLFYYPYLQIPNHGPISNIEFTKPVFVLKKLLRYVFFLENPQLPSSNSEIRIIETISGAGWTNIRTLRPPHNKKRWIHRGSNCRFSAYKADVKTLQTMEPVFKK